MIRSIFILACCAGFALTGFCQNEPPKNQNTVSALGQLKTQLQSFVPDTSGYPDDRITRKIIELRRLRGDFNIEQVLAADVSEAQQKKEMPEAEAQFLLSGNGKRWLNNAVIHIYRQHFTYRELRQMARFYKTSAGAKMASDFPLVMMECAAAAQMVKDGYQKQERKDHQ